MANHPWWRGWVLAVTLPAFTLVSLGLGWPRWGTMWLLSFLIFASCKWLTWRRTHSESVPRWKQLAYLLAWPGLDAQGFFNHAVSRCPDLREWAFALFKMVFGVSVLVLLLPNMPEGNEYLLGWCGMVGCVFCLHFGLFHVLSCFWRTLGVQAKPLMNWPILACSLSDFWGNRWNTAFRDLTHRFLFRPLSSWLGPGKALIFGFLFSGVIHDLVISLPAGGGYGGPTLFFVIQALGLFAERSRLGRRIGIGKGVIGWLFTVIVLTSPAVLLFHNAFLLNVVVPFLQFLGAWPCPPNG